MKTNKTFIIFIVSSLITCSCASSKDDINLLSDVIAEICQEFFIKKSIEFDIIIYGESMSHLNDIGNKFIEQVSWHVPISVLNIKNTTKWDHKIRKSAVIFFSQESSLIEVFSERAQLANEHQKELKLLIFTDFLSNNDPVIEKYINDMTYVRSYLYFFANFRDFIHFYTYEHFLEGNCNQMNRLMLNTFDKSTKKWKNEVKSHQKFQNFNNCPLVLRQEFNEFLHFKNRNSEIVDCARKRNIECNELAQEILLHEKPDGIFVEIFRMMGQVANFKPKFSFDFGSSSPNGNNKNPIGKIYIGNLENSLNVDFVSTTMTINSHYMFAITPTEFYNNYEKLLLPFDDITWTLLLLTFLVAFIVIFILNFLPERIKLLLYGGTVHSPVLNVIHIFFGISQMKLPDASVPRFILMLFITFCLIFRTCYQSELFEFMTSDMRKPPPSTVEDLIERNYTIVSCLGYKDTLMEINRIKDYR